MGNVARFGPNLRFEIRDRADVGHARRTLRTYLEGHRWSGGNLDQLDLALTEVGNNLLEHVPEGGELLARLSNLSGGGEFELVAVDRGPGGATLGKQRVLPCLDRPRPGLSSGLRAVSRLCGQMALHSPPGEGTLVLARFFQDCRPVTGLRCSGVVRPLEGEADCGDAWGYRDGDEGLTVLVVDGLGHGSRAREAAETALACLDELEADWVGWFERLNQSLRCTRGAALAAARVRAQQLEFVGVGNLAAWLLAPGVKRSLPSRPGIMGANQRLPSIDPRSYPWCPEARLIIQTDGVAAYHGDSDSLACLDPALAAAMLYRDSRRGVDDAAVVVVGEVTQTPNFG